MKSIWAPLFSLVNELTARCATLDKAVACAHSYRYSNTSKAQQSQLTSMEQWNSVRLQPELFYSGAFFGIGSADMSSLNAK